MKHPALRGQTRRKISTFQKAANLKVKELKTSIGVVKDIEISAGRIFNKSEDSTVQTSAAMTARKEEKWLKSVEMPINPQTAIIAMSTDGGGFKIILKDAKIVAKKLIMRKLKKESAMSWERIHEDA